MKQLQARCLCGGVRIDAEVEAADIGVCHCDNCRRWSAGPFMAIEGAKSVVMAGTDLVSVYRSSEWGERGFCSQCGSNLFFRTTDGEHFAISATAVADLGEARITNQIFIDSKPDWYSLAEQTKTMTGREVFAQFAPAGSDSNG